MHRAAIFLTCLLGLAQLPLEAGSIRNAKPAQKTYDLREGDIVFQGNAGPQSDAIRAATHSPFTHCGVVFEKNGKWMVMEAIEPVQVTPLEHFVARSLPKTFHAMRLKQRPKDLKLDQAKQWAGQQQGLPYDLRFQWGNEALYCSEFVWKLYDQAGVKLCETRTFGSYDLEAPVVKRVIQERYGGVDQLPRMEPVVAPSDLATSPLLVEVPEAPGKKSP